MFASLLLLITCTRSQIYCTFEANFCFTCFAHHLHIRMHLPSCMVCIHGACTDAVKQRNSRWLLLALPSAFDDSPTRHNSLLCWHTGRHCEPRVWAGRREKHATRKHDRSTFAHNGHGKSCAQLTVTRLSFKHETTIFSCSWSIIHQNIQQEQTSARVQLRISRSNSRTPLQNSSSLAQ